MPPQDPLIDGTRVPDLTVLALQQTLNARVRAGILSGPLLVENGALDAATQAKQREQEACDTLALAALEPEIPDDPAEWEAARAADEALLQQLSQELELIPDTPYLNFDHKAPSAARLQQLAEQFETKWNSAQAVQAQLRAILGEFPSPGSLLLYDGSFDYMELQSALGRLTHAEIALVELSSDSDDGVETLLLKFRQQLAYGLLPATMAPPPSPEPTPLETKRGVSTPGPPRAPASIVEHEAPPDPFSPNPQWERMGREMDTWGPEHRAQLIREGLAQAPVSDQVPRLVHSLLRTHPGMLPFEWLDALDGYACRALSEDTQRLPKLPPRLRLTLVKHCATADQSPSGRVKHALAGACALSLVAEHPRATLEILASPAPDAQVPLMLTVLSRLDDHVIQALGKDALHTLTKRLSASQSAEQRRVMARLVRLMGKN